MNAPRMFTRLSTAVCGMLVLPAWLASQRPPQPGQLTVKSTPAGASITIDGQLMKRPTNYTYYVSPGTHRVSLSAPPACTQQTTVPVTAGTALTLNCTEKGWEPVKPTAK
jgi:PEGA domain